MALVGNLKDLKLPSLIQLNCMERNNAKLTIERGGKYGFIYFEDGQVTHAEFDPHIGEEAVYDLLTLFDGKFKVENDVRPPVRTIHTSWSNLLLEGLHKLDHAQDEPESKHRNMFERMLTLKGVQGVALVDEKGKIVDSTTDSTRNLPSVAFIMLQADKIGTLTENGATEYVSILMPGKRYMMVHYAKKFVLIILDPKVKSDTILPLIKQALGH